MNKPNELEAKAYELYDESYQVYLESWHKNRQIAIDLMQQNLKPQGSTVNVLSVGAGSGDFDVQVIKALQQNLLPNFTLKYVAVEPNPIDCQRYKKAISVLDLANVEMVIQADKIEDFQTTEKFDFIHYTHCLYHMPGSEKQIVQNGMQMLKDNGFLVITLCISTKETTILKIISKYAELTGEGFPEMLNMHQMQSMIGELGLFYKLVTYPEYLDVKHCFDKNSTAGKMLLDFMCQADSSLLNDEQQKEILNVLESNICKQNGSKLVPENAAIMIISKDFIGN